MDVDFSQRFLLLRLGYRITLLPVHFYKSIEPSPGAERGVMASGGGGRGGYSLPQPLCDRTHIRLRTGFLLVVFAKLHGIASVFRSEHVHETLLRGVSLRLRFCGVCQSL